MDRTNWRRSALLLAAGAMAGAAVAVGVVGPRRPANAAENSAATTTGAPAAAEAPTYPSNEIADYPQLD
jgi:hypothetical protein